METDTYLYQVSVSGFKIPLGKRQVKSSLRSGAPPSDPPHILPSPAQARSAGGEAVSRTFSWNPRKTAAATSALLLAAALAGCAPARPRPQGATPGAALTASALERLNPRLAGYRDLGTLRGMNVRVRAKQGEPGVQLLVGSAGQLVGVRALLPSTVWQPWFDQERGATVNAMGERTSEASPRQGAPGSVQRPGTRTPTPPPPGAPSAPGQFYTHTLWLVDPDRLRDTAGASLPGPALDSLDRLRQINPKLKDIRRMTDFVPGMGFHWGFDGPGLAVMVDRNGRITGVEAVFPEAAGPRPHFDQMPGEVSLVRQTGERRYSQHVWFVNPSGIR